MTNSTAVRKPSQSKASTATGTTTPAGQTNPSRFSLPELRSIAWQAIAKHATAVAESCRDMAPAGAAENVRTHFVFEVDGKKGAESFDLNCTIDSDSVCASSSLKVSQAELVAFLLGKFNAATRSSILANIVDTWRENGESLPTDPAILKDSEEALKKIRKENSQKRRGSVKVRETAKVPPLAIVG